MALGTEGERRETHGQHVIRSLRHPPEASM